jgi:HPt (histidine-containing phosphotransfer) domain-containing protein
MTAHAMAGDEQKSLQAGMNGHVTKPIDPDQLFATLQKWIKPVAERAVVPKSSPASGGPPVLDVPTEPDQAVPDEAVLPESLAGFDLAAGLKRLMGNKRLYRKLLVDFGTKYTETARQIREALDAKDFEQAHSLVHNLKGLAGNLEATELLNAAVEMEKLVKGEQTGFSKKQLKQKLTDLEIAIDKALESVQNLRPQGEEKSLETSLEMPAVLPAELSKEAAIRIRDALELGDIMRLKSIAEELQSQSEALVPFSDSLIQLADNFDFDGIAKLAAKLEI